MNYLDRVKATYIENWPASLCRLSFAQVDIPLTLAEAEAIGASNGELAEEFPPPHPRDLSAIEKRLDDAISRFPDGAFVRLGSRSPKDSWLGHREGFRVTDAKKALAILCDSSERVADDLRLAVQNGYAPHLFVREWKSIPKWAEFRCFMKGRGLIGTSQYDYFHAYPEIKRHKDTIQHWLLEWFLTQFKPACTHLDDAVFDVWVDIKERVSLTGMTDRSVEIKLIEINPFFEMTDPCLFDWRNGGDFDYGFRYVSKMTKAA